MSIDEQYASVRHDSQTCEICIDIDLAEYHMNEASSWKARLALLKLWNLLRSWHHV